MIYILLLTKIDGERPIDYDDNNDKYVAAKGLQGEGKQSMAWGGIFMFLFLGLLFERVSKGKF
jgi:hypothetical protein